MDKELRDLIKDGDVTAKNLWIRVLDEDSGKEGWIPFMQVIEGFADDIIESLKELSQSERSKNNG